MVEKRREFLVISEGNKHYESKISNTRTVTFNCLPRYLFSLIKLGIAASVLPMMVIILANACTSPHITQSAYEIFSKSIPVFEYELIILNVCMIYIQTFRMSNSYSNTGILLLKIS